MTADNRAQPPTALTATTGANQSVTLNWNPSSTPGVTYTVLRSTTPGLPNANTITVGSGLTNTSIVDSGLNATTRYYYAVSAQVCGTSSDLTPEASSGPPTVTLTAPANNQIFAAPATITLTANATDSDLGDSIIRVEFYQGSTRLYTDTTAPYGYTWSGVVAGSYSLTAKAYDAGGFAATSVAVNVTVSNAPVVTISAPTNGATYTAPATITISATASEAGGTISKVEFYQGSTLLGTDTTSPYSYNWTNVAAGNYALTAKAYDTQNNSTTSGAVNVTVNSAKRPVVTITSPTNNTSYTPPASVNISATASETGGTLSKVEFYQGSTLLGTDTTSPYSYTWTNVAAGNYALTAKAYDTQNNSTTSSAVNIVVGDPCSGYCTPWLVKPLGQSGSLGTGAICHEIVANMSGGNCSTMTNRTFELNGTTMTCNSQNWASLPAKHNGGYCIQVTAGGSANAAYATF